MMCQEWRTGIKVFTLESLQHLPDEDAGVTLSVAALLNDPVKQLAAIQQFLNEVDVQFGFKDLVESSELRSIDQSHDQDFLCDGSLSLKSGLN